MGAGEKMSISRLVKEGYKLTKEECLKIGGHCYEQGSCAISAYPPIYHRICKHCGHRQESVTIPEKDLWRDD